nr:reverse transcriptase domain-containing protein [Tanacetum cinerariifolium]
MDWLMNHYTVIMCDEKIVWIPYGDEVLIVQGDRSSKGKKLKLSIISCTKAQKYIKKGYLIFLAQVTKKETEDKSEEKRLEEVPTVRDFPEVTNSTTSTYEGQVVNRMVVTCLECRRQGHYRSDCPKLKDQNHGNKTRNKNGIGEARGPCTMRCGKCNKIGHLTRDCKFTNSTTFTQRGQVVNEMVVTCFECGRQGRYRSDSPKLKDQNRGNKARNKNKIGKASEKAYVLGGGDANLDSNVIKGTFLLNNHYPFVLFDSGANRSFVSTTFSTMLDITLIL